jgi:hypothetical protein
MDHGVESAQAIDLLGDLTRPPHCGEVAGDDIEGLCQLTARVPAARPSPCPMCMGAIYWSRIDRVFFGNSLKDTSAIGFDDAFQYEDFKKPWGERRIPIAENFERDTTLKSFKAWMDKEDRHPY